MLKLKSVCELAMHTHFTCTGTSWIMIFVHVVPLLQGKMDHFGYNGLVIAKFQPVSSQQSVHLLVCYAHY